MVEATKRCLRLGAGWTMILAGVVMIPLPGPGLPVMLAGLALLSRDSAWARGMMSRLRKRMFSRSAGEPSGPTSAGGVPSRN